MIGVLTIGDVGAALGLDGSSRDGWDCPVCQSKKTISEVARGRMGRCGVCETVFRPHELHGAIVGANEKRKLK